MKLEVPGTDWAIIPLESRWFAMDLSARRLGPFEDWRDALRVVLGGQMEDDTPAKRVARMLKDRGVPFRWIIPGTKNIYPSVDIDGAVEVVVLGDGREVAVVRERFVRGRAQGYIGVPRISTDDGGAALAAAVRAAVAA